MITPERRDRQSQWRLVNHAALVDVEPAPRAAQAVPPVAEQDPELVLERNGIARPPIEVDVKAIADCEALRYDLVALARISGA